MIKVSAVSYLNTKPFVYGLVEKGLEKVMDLSLDIPSMCAEKLASGRVDLGLIPVAIIPKLKTPHIISDFCIGSEGAVKTVCLYSRQPLETVRRVWLDYQSRTSVQLAKILLKHHWQFNPQFLPAQPGYERNAAHDEAALVIGDRTIGLEDEYPFVYDLGKAWKDFTGLPFVYAAWVSNRELPHDFIEKFNAALGFGINNLRKVIDKYQPGNPDFSLKDYYTKYINYQLDQPKRQGLELFLDYLKGKEKQSPYLVFC